MYAVVQIGSTILRSECMTTRNVDCAAAELASANATPPATAPNHLLLTVIFRAPFSCTYGSPPVAARPASFTRKKEATLPSQASSDKCDGPVATPSRAARRPQFRTLRLAYLRWAKPVLVDQHVVDQPGAAQPRRGKHDQAPAVRLRRGEGLRLAHGEVLRPEAGALESGHAALLDRGERFVLRGRSRGIAQGVVKLRSAGALLGREEAVARAHREAIAFAHDRRADDLDRQAQ